MTYTVSSGALDSTPSPTPPSSEMLAMQLLETSTSREPRARREHDVIHRTGSSTHFIALSSEGDQAAATANM